MTLDEFASWLAYRRLRGPLNPTLRMESALAQIALLICAGAGLKKKSGAAFEADDFMPWLENEASLDDVLKIFQGDS